MPTDCYVWGLLPSFLGGSDIKESAYHARDPASIPVSGRSPGEGNGNPLQYSYLGEFLDRGAWQAIVHGVTKSDVTEQLTPYSYIIMCIDSAVQLSALFIFRTL